MKGIINSLFTIMLIFLIGLQRPGRLAAQEREIDIFGYFEPQLAGFQVSDEFQQLSSNKLRVDLKGAVQDKIFFNANVNFLGYYGATTYYYGDYLSDDMAALVPDSYRDFLIWNLENEIILDNASLKLVFAFVEVTVGKQQVSPGVGYAWNPTDVINVKNPLDPTYEQTGLNALRLDIPLGNKAGWVLLYGPEEDYKQSLKYTQIKINVGHFDLSIMGGDLSREVFDYDSFQTRNEQRQLFGGSVVGELFGVGVWSELAFNIMGRDDDYFEGLAGLDYTFENGLYLLAEYYRNEQGKDDDKKFTFMDWLSFFAGETKVMSQDHLFANILFPATDLLTVRGTVITSLNDRSMVLVPAADYNFSDNLDFTLMGNIYVGSEGKAYSAKLGSGGLIRVRLFF